MPVKKNKPLSPAKVTAAKRSAVFAQAQAAKARAQAETKAWRTFENSYKGGAPTRMSEYWTRGQGYRYGTSGEREQVANASDRAENAYQNNPVAKTLIETETDNVIGDGLNYQPSTKSKAWNREAQDKYYEWLDVASVRGSDIHTGCELTRLLWEGSRVAGDIGWILVSRGAESRVQVVSRQNLVTPDGMHGDPKVIDGIRFDEWGAPVTYYILSHDERGLKRQSIPIAARDFVFLPHIPKTKPNQARGETCYMQVFDMLSHIDRYVDGVALAAWMGTVFGIVFKQADAAKQVALLGNAYNSAGTMQKALTLEGGMVKYVGSDDEVAQVQAHQPLQQTPDFIRAMLRLAGMVFGQPLEAFARDMSTCNFASARIGLLPFYRACRIRGQGTFGPRWSRTIRWWLSRERYRDQDDPKRWKTKFPEDYWRHELLSNAWEYTDPVSEVSGDLMQCDAGFKSHQQVIAERGRDYERINRERAEHEANTKGLPKVHSGMTRHPQLGVGPQGDPLGQEAVEPAGQTEPAAGRISEDNNGNNNGN